MRVYYFQHARHLPEFVVLAFGAGLAWWYRGRLRHREMSITAGALLVFYALLPHANPYYLLLPLPFWLLVALSGYAQAPRAFWVLPATLLLAALAEYGYRAKANLHLGYSDGDLERVRLALNAAEREAGFAPGRAFVVGDYSLWYAHPARYLANGAHSAAVERGDLYLCYQHALEQHTLNEAGSAPCDELAARVKLRELARLELRGNLLSIEQRVP